MYSGRSFSHQEKKQIALQIEKIKNKKYFKEIFKIIHEDNNKYTINDNGVYININILPDSTLFKIKHFIESIDYTKNIIPVPKEYIPYNSDEFQSSDIKLSVQEKNMLKKIKNDTKMSWDNKCNDSDVTSTEKNNIKIDVKPFHMMFSE